MQPQLLKQETPPVIGESIIGRKNIIEMSDIEVEHELQSIAPQLAKSRQALKAIEREHRLTEQYTRELLASAKERSVSIPDGYQTTETSAITIIGGAVGFDTFFRDYPGFLRKAITIDYEKLQEILAPVLSLTGPTIDIPVKVENKKVITFDWDTLASTPAPEPVIEPAVVHEPLEKVSTLPDGDPKA